MCLINVSICRKLLKQMFQNKRHLTKYMSKSTPKSLDYLSDVHKAKYVCTRVYICGLVQCMYVFVCVRVCTYVYVCVHMWVSPMYVCVYCMYVLCI